MAHILYAVANATGDEASLTSKEHPGDDGAIAGLGVTHTGGKDGNWIFLPDCSDSGYWKDHHIKVAAKNGAWLVTFWVNDQDDRLFYWSDFDGFSTEHPVNASKGVTDCTIMIMRDRAGKIAVEWRHW